MPSDHSVSIQPRQSLGPLPPQNQPAPAPPRINHLAAVPPPLYAPGAAPRYTRPQPTRPAAAAPPARPLSPRPAANPPVTAYHQAPPPTPAPVPVWTHPVHPGQGQGQIPPLPAPPAPGDDYLTTVDGQFQELLTRPPSVDRPRFPIPDYDDMPAWMQNIEDKITELQRMTRQFMLDTPFCSAMLDMGSGKTLATLSALSIARPAGYVLVIAPKAIAVNTWANEIADWNIPLRAVSLALSDTGTDLTRVKRHERYAMVRNGEYPPSVFVIGQDNVADLVDYFAKDWPFSTVIIDEVQGFKNPSAKRFKAVKKIRPQITRLIQLTGTPVPNSLMDLWAPMYLLDEGEALGHTITAYRSRYFHAEVLPNGGRTYRELEGALREVLRRIPHLALASKNTELKLPELYIRDHDIELGADFYDEYKRFVTEQTIDAVTVALATDLPDPDTTEDDDLGLSGGYATPSLATVLSVLDDEDTVEATISADNAAVLRMKKLQMASGTIYLDTDSGDEAPWDEDPRTVTSGQPSITDLLISGAVDEAGNPIEVVDLKSSTDHQLGYRTLFRCGNRVAVNIHNAKIDVLADIIDQANSPVLVAYHFRSDRDKIHHELRRRGIDAQIFNKKPAMFAAWNRSEIPVMLIHPASAGHGLNLQHGGHTLVWYSLPDSLEHYLQANARLYRPGQKHDVTIHRLIVARTEDAKQPERLRRKEIKQSIVLDALHHDPHNQNVDREDVIEQALTRGKQRAKVIDVAVNDLDDDLVRDRIHRAVARMNPRPSEGDENTPE